MADKTLVLITQDAGPHVVPAVNYQTWTPAIDIRDTDDNEVTLAAPQPVRLDENGNGSVEVKPGVWFVDEVVPQNGTPRRAVLVPASAAAVQYTDLSEVTNLDQLGYGPTWAEQSRQNALLALAAAFAAEKSATDAETWARISEEFALQAGAPRYSVSTDGKTASFEASSYVTPSADGKYLTISGGNIAAGFRVPRLGTDGLYRTDQLPMNALVAAVLAALPTDLIETAILAQLDNEASPIRDRLTTLYGGPGGDQDITFYLDTDGRLAFTTRSDR
jgi:hypothetical protein